MRIAVIGGGLQGCGVALELAVRGLRVDLFERGPRLLRGASHHSEGKIHLGYACAADDTLRTARLWPPGPQRSLQRWLGDDWSDLAFSTPFRYAVHRDSLRTVDELERRYRSIAQLVQSAFREHSSTSPSQAAQFRRLEAGESWPYTHNIVMGYETGEIAVDTDTLADAVERVVLDRTEIRTLCGASIEACRRVTDDRFELVVQIERLGWPGNFNWLARKCDREFFYYWQQDDLASNDYLLSLRETLREKPAAAFAYTDVQWIGDRSDRDTAIGIYGSPLERALQGVEALHYVPLQGLVRARCLPDRVDPIPLVPTRRTPTGVRVSRRSRRNRRLRADAARPVSQALP